MYLPSEIRNFSSTICPVVFFFCPEPAGDTRILFISNKIKCECNEEKFGVALNSPRKKKSHSRRELVHRKTGHVQMGKSKSMVQKPSVHTAWGVEMRE
jgi:hypothetical protein